MPEPTQESDSEEDESTTSESNSSIDEHIANHSMCQPELAELDRSAAGATDFQAGISNEIQPCRQLRPSHTTTTNIQHSQDVLPQPPVLPDPIPEANNPSDRENNPTEGLTTLPDAFYVYREYPTRPVVLPDQQCDLSDYYNEAYDKVNSVDLAPESDIQKIIAPCPNISAFLLQHWHWLEGSRKTQDSRDSLVKNVLLHPRFSLNDIRNVNWTKLDEQLRNKRTTGLSAGWHSTPLRIRVPQYDSSTSSHSTSFETSEPLHHRKLMDIVTDGFSHNNPKHFHYVLFKLCHHPPNASSPQQLYGEFYNCDAMLRAHEEVQSLPAEPGCSLPRAVAALMVSSDGAPVAQFSTTSVHPIYAFLGNQSKYERCKPTSNSCFDIAHIPPLPDSISDFLARLSRDGKTSRNTAMLAHLKRELMHEVWAHLLDDEFIAAWVHGKVIKCADGITRRVYPRIFTYSADYPEKVAIATIRNMGACPCPRCLVSKSKLKHVGEVNDLKFREKHPRVDTEQRQELVKRARNLIYSRGKKPDATAVDALLSEHSLVPTQNAFSSRLYQFGFDYHKMLVVDLMHEFELGVWKNVFIHLMRIIQSSGSHIENEFNARFRSVSPFGPTTIRRFSDNVSELKKLAARDYEDILQCCIPVFEGLLPLQFSKKVLELLFLLAFWHSLAKLRLHSQATLASLESTTRKLCSKLRAFARYTSSYNDVETRSETQARQLREAKRSESSKTQASKKKPRKGFSLETYKLHCLPDYVSTIKEFGTTDSYSTQIGELQHRRVKALFGRTNMKDSITQVTNMERTQAALTVMKSQLENVMNLPSISDKNSDINMIGPGLMLKLDPGETYNIASNQQKFLHLPTWLMHNLSDPSTETFLPTLRAHLLSRMLRVLPLPGTTEYRNAEESFRLHNDRIYQHALLGLNYTSYDLRRCSETIHCGAEDPFVAVKASNDGTHPFWYARVLGIFHAQVSVHGSSYQHINFLWVRWLARDLTWRSGWDSCRLDRVSYYSNDPADESLPAFDFIDPGDVIRAAHLIPAYSCGKTFDYLPTPSKIAHDTTEDGDWKYWYVMRFVDRDMMMWYHGGGIGHAEGAPEGDQRQDDLLSENNNSDSDHFEDDHSETESNADGLGGNTSRDGEEESWSGWEDEYESEEDMEPLQYEH